MSEKSRGAIRALTMLVATPLVAVTACKKAQEAPKTPLSQMTAPADSTKANPHNTMSPEARAALDSGNALFKAGKYADALKSYQTASQLAPLNAAPFYGIWMAADKLGKKALADSASAQIKAREGPSTEMLSDSQLRNLHANSPAAPATTKKK